MSQLAYPCSHASHVTIKKRYGRKPFVTFFILIKSQKITAICRELSSMAAIAPAGVANQIQKVVAAFHKTNDE